MIIKLETLPNVTNEPGDSQKRIAWIKNGEPLNAASTRYGHEGELNRVGVQLQENIEFVHHEVELTVEQLNKNSTEIESIKESLEITTDVDAVTQVYKNRDDIILVNSELDLHEQEIASLKESSTKLTAEVGVYNPNLDPKHRTVRGDIVFIKDEIGSYPGQNKNGEVDLDSSGSGMKLRIISNSDAISKVTSRVQDLEDNFIDSDVGALSGRIDEIRTEIGPKTLANGTSIYNRIIKADQDIGLLRTTQENISAAINLTGPETISSRVSTLESRTLSIDATVNSAGTGLVDKVGAIEVKIGSASDPYSILGRLDTIQTSQDEIKTVVGSDASSGMRGQIAWIQQKTGIVGPGETPDPTSIEGRLTEVIGVQSQQQSSIQDIQAEIGNGTTGITGQLNEVRKTVYGNSGATDPIEKSGLLESVKKINSDYVRDVTDLNAYLRTKDQWIKKSMAMGSFKGKDLSADLTADGFEYSFGPGLVAADFNNQIRVINSEIVIDDSAIYEVSASVIIEKAHADKVLDLVFYVDDVSVDVNSVGVKTVAGYQVVSFDWLGQLEETDRLRLAIKAVEPASQVVLNVEAVDITVVPAR